jgi:hypothetical protein
VPKRCIVVESRRAFRMVLTCPFEIRMPEQRYFLLASRLERIFADFRPITIAQAVQPHSTSCITRYAYALYISTGTRLLRLWLTERKACSTRIDSTHLSVVKRRYCNLKSNIQQVPMSIAVDRQVVVCYTLQLYPSR